jgi:hypothetical protein
MKMQDGRMAGLQEGKEERTFNLPFLPFCNSAILQFTIA